MTHVVTSECVRCFRTFTLPPGASTTSPCCFSTLRPVTGKRESRAGQSPHTVGLLAGITLAIMLLVVAMMRCH